MATPKEKVFRKFLTYIEDREWALADGEVVLEMMENYLEDSAAMFVECSKDLTLENDYISGDLDSREIMILARGMIDPYLMPKILREENLKQTLGSSDIKGRSNANMLDKMIKLQDVNRKELKRLKTEYTYIGFGGFN